MFYNSNGAISVGSGGSIDHDYNGYFNSYNVPSEANRVVSSTDPFVNRLGGDFHLASGSAAIDSGLSLGSPYNLDKDGVARPQGTSYDRGAYEFK